MTVWLEEKHGLTAVFLDSVGDDHIVTQQVMVKGFERDITLGYGSPEWETAVARAKRGAAFL